MQDQQHYLLNVLELLERTRFDWKSQDSRNIEILSSLLLPPLLFPVLISNLQVTLLSIVELLPELLEDVTWLLTLQNTCDRVIYSFPVKNRTRNGNQRYCGLLSCFSNGFPRTCLLH